MRTSSSLVRLKGSEKIEFGSGATAMPVGGTNDDSDGWDSGFGLEEVLGFVRASCMSSIFASIIMSCGPSDPADVAR